MLIHPTAEHRATLNFYCVTCRVVICRDCTVVAHQQGDNHTVLDTPDALSALRTQVVAHLRHYTVLASLHATLTRVYHKYFSMVCYLDMVPIGLFTGSFTSAFTSVEMLLQLSISTLRMVIPL